MAKQFSQKTKIVCSLLVFLICVHVVNLLFDGALQKYGILPRATDKWFHIFTAPFVHGSWAHLLNNLIGLTTFSALCLLRWPLRFYMWSSLFIITLSGVLVWAFARKAIHLGASGWIFGLWSMTISMALFDRRLMNIAISLITILFYGGMIFGVLPKDSKVSFESHLFGAISGVVCAYTYVRINKAKKK